MLAVEKSSQPANSRASGTSTESKGSQNDETETPKDPFIDNSTKLTRPVLVLQLPRPYWEQRPNIFAVKNSSPLINSRASVPSMESKRPENEKIESSAGKTLEDARTEKSEGKAPGNLNVTFDYETAVADSAVVLAPDNANAAEILDDAEPGIYVCQSSPSWLQKSIFTCGKSPM